MAEGGRKGKMRPSMLAPALAGTRGEVLPPSRPNRELRRSMSLSFSSFFARCTLPSTVFRNFLRSPGSSERERARFDVPGPAAGPLFADRMGRAKKSSTEVGAGPGNLAFLRRRSFILLPISYRYIALVLVEF